MKKKVLSLLLSLAMLVALAVPALAAEPAPVAQTAPVSTEDVAGKLVILHTNDTHGGDVAAAGKSIGTAGVAQLKKDYQAAGAQVLLFSAGDAIQGAPLVNQDKGVSEFAFMSAAGYDAMTLGNHEFDWGLDNLEQASAHMTFPILCANIVDKDTGDSHFTANKIFETAGMKVGVFGLDTPETATKTNPKNIAAIKFLGQLDAQELYDCAEAQVAALKEQGADFIVCLAHLGVDAESVGRRSVDLASKVDGIDLIVDGHSHSTNTEIADVIAKESLGEGNVVNGATIVSTGTKLANVGKVVIDPAAKTVSETALISAADYSGVDETVNQLVNDRDAAVNAELAAVVGQTEVLLDGKRAPGVRTQETNLGDFSCDAILWQARKELGEDAVDAAFTNGGGIRETIPAGDISLNIMKTVFPYGNQVATLDLTGAQLLEMLEANTYCLPTAIGGFPQVSGIEYSVNTEVPYENGEQYPNSTYYAPAKPGSRVTISTVNGQPWDAEATYTLATNDFTAAGGDAYGVLLEAANLVVIATPLEDALINYAKEVLGGTITAAQYGKSQGRIQILYKGIDLTKWYAEAAKTVIDAGVMVSTGKGFEPYENATRSTVFEALYKAAGSPEVTTASEFSDVPDDAWYADSAAWARANNITKGVGGNRYNPDDPITRAEIVTAVARYAEYVDGETVTAAADLSGYTDAATLSSWAKAPFAWAVASGVISGKGETLAPKDSATRAELAQILTNYLSVEPMAENQTTKAVLVDKYGNTYVDVTGSAVARAGYTVGDVLSVTVGDKTVSMPLCTGYSNVDQGSVLAMVNGGYLELSINRGDFATTYGVAAKGEDGTWTMDESVAITIAMEEKGGYLDELAIRDIESKRTNNRDDYASDEIFANFRAITAGNIAEGVLYRTSSPINPELGRNAVADRLVKEAGVKTVVNLADCVNNAKAYEGFEATNYASLKVVYLNMGVDMYSEESLGDLKNGLEFMIENPGPYAFHCTEGKDRAGYFAFLLEALMGASVQEIRADYMLSFENYYFVNRDTDQWNKIAESNIMKDILKLAGVESEFDLGGVDLAAAAERYMIETIGLTAEQVATLKTNLSTPVALG